MSAFAGSAFQEIAKVFSKGWRRGVIKRGVRLHPSTAWAVAMPIIREVYKDFGYTAVITSGIEGKHKSGTLHTEGKAFDFRTKSVQRQDLHPLVAHVVESLGDEFDVLLEQQNQPNEHLHVEFQPK